MEVKNKRIETEKRRMEVEASQQRETVKKAAFLQVRLLLLSIFAIIIFFSFQAFPNPISNLRHWQPSTKKPVTFLWGFVKYYYALFAIEHHSI